MPPVEVPTKTWDEPLQFLSGKAPSAPASHTPRGTREHITVKFAINVDGTVGEIRVVETSNPLVNDWVIEAVRGWRFKPATKGGVAQVIWAQQAFTLGF
jgi:TonB family protein